MRRTVAWILGIAGGLAALLLLAVGIAVSTIDPRTLIEPVAARVKAETGRDLSFAGPVALKLSLEPRLVAADVTLSNAAWAQSPQMAAVKRVEVQVALLPLLRRRFDVVEVALIEPTIALETNAQGAANWEFAAPSPQGPSPPTAAASSAAAVIAVGNIAIRDGTLTFHDGATGRITRITIDRLALRSRSGSAPVDAEFKGKVDDVAVAVSGNLGPLDALRERRWPYPVAVQGDVGGRPAKASTKVAVVDGTTTLDALDVTWGALSLAGDLRVGRANGRMRYAFNLSVPAASLQEVAGAVGAAAGPPPPGGGTPSTRYVISDRPLPLVALASVDVDGALSIGTLTVDARNVLRSVELKLVVAPGTVDVTSFRAAAYGGSLTGRVTVDAAGDGAPRVKLHVDGRQLDLEALLTSIGEQRTVRGGKTTLALDVAARGRSPHEWAASATGEALVNVGRATLVNTGIDVDNVLGQLTSAVNPFRARDPSTELVCAVIRLPLRDGVARVDRSIAMETTKIGVSASGTLDLRDERVDFTVRPRLREGIPLDLPSFAELVHFTGPLRHPEVRIDAARSAVTVAKIGAAISTGGLSMLGSSLISKVADPGDECGVALGRAPAPSKPRPDAAPAAGAPAAVGNEIGKALGRLFGK